MTTKGTPGNVTPRTSASGVVTCCSYQTGGACRLRWGSLASRGSPEAVCVPETTHEFEPNPGGDSNPESHAARSGSTRAAPGGGPSPFLAPPAPTPSPAVARPNETDPSDGSAFRRIGASWS